MENNKKKEVADTSASLSLFSGADDGDSSSIGSSNKIRRRVKQVVIKKIIKFMRTFFHDNMHFPCWIFHYFFTL